MGLRRALTGLALLLLTAAPAAAQDYCQLQTSDNFSGYKMRDGNRCEGIYAQDVSANLLQVSSFAAHFAEFAESNSARLHISWQAPAAGTLWIAGRGRARNSFYGLDTAVPAAAGEFSWPAKILRDKGFRKRSLGFLAWLDHSAPHIDKLHLPISVSPDSTTTPGTGSYELVIRPGAVFKEIYLALDRHCNGSYQAVWPDTPMARDYYSAQRVQHRLEVAGSNGVYRLRINAQNEHDEYAPTRSFHFMHQGNGGPDHCGQ